MCDTDPGPHDSEEAVHARKEMPRVEGEEGQLERNLSGSACDGV